MSITHFDPQTDTLRILVADDGKGIHASLQENPRYQGITASALLTGEVGVEVADYKSMNFGMLNSKEESELPRMSTGEAIGACRPRQSKMSCATIAPGYGQLLMV